MQCTQCKKDIPDGAKRCPECQADLRNWFAKHKILTVVLIFFILGLILSSVDDSNSTTKTVVNEEGKKIKVQKEYQKVIDLKTTSTKNSDTFKLEGGKQKLIYTITKKQYAGCNIYLLDENTDLHKDGGIPVVMMAEESGETILRKSNGNYYLSVQASNTTCEVELLEMR